MRSAGLKNITAKHLGELDFLGTSQMNPAKLTFSTRVTVTLSNCSAHTLYSRVHPTASERQASSHADRI